MDRIPHAEIAGGGFAGLVAAAALAQRGWTVRVHERDPELRAFGAGIFVWNNGLRVLGAIGAYDDVVTGAHHVPVYEDRHENQRTTWTEFGSADETRLLTMTRQHLYAAVLSCAEREGVEILTGSEIVDAHPDGRLVDAKGKAHSADLVIGADGVGSKVREAVGLRTRRSTGQHGIIRLLAPPCRDQLEKDDWHHIIDFWNLEPHGLRILYVPCNDDEVYLAMMSPLGDSRASEMPPRSDLWEEAFPQLAPVIRSIASGGRHDPYETSKIPRWSVGKVAIVGDAAHAMVPSLGQGAGIAMSNALALAVAVDGAQDIPAALLDWEARERPMTEHTQDHSARVARERVETRASIYDDLSLRAARSTPTGTEHFQLPH